MIKDIWKKCNIVTFMGVMFAVLGIYLCYLKLILWAVIMLGLSGICDAIDGPIARKINKGNSSYGVELDSLCDIISFAILPINICMTMGYTKLIDLVIYILFAICGVSRLAYYNTNCSDEGYVIGIPITCSAMIMPLIYLAIKNEIIFMAALVILSVGEISNIKINKLKLKGKVLLSIIGIIVLICVIMFEYLGK